MTLLFPVLFGLGVMFTFRGIKVICSQGLDEEGRRKGFLKLGTGLVLAVLLVVMFVGTGGRW